MGILIAIVVILAIFWLMSWVIGSLIGLAISAIFWAAAGYIATRVMGGKGESLPQIILIGLIGGFIGSIILRALNLHGIEDIWLIGSIISGSIGAIALIAVVRLLGDKNFAR